MVAGFVPNAGDIVKINLDPRTGHEQGGWRPALVLSPRLYNGKTGLAVVVPITNQVKGYSFEVQLPGQMKTTGVVLSDAIKNVGWRARKVKYIETALPAVMNAVRERVALLLGFPT